MKVLTSYVIASVQRSGTHLLCSLLRSTGLAGSPAEHFLSRPGETWEARWHSSSRTEYIEGVLRRNTGHNGVFGTVIMWSYFERMLQMLQEIPTSMNVKGAELLSAVLHRPKYIWLRRRNRVEQAVSWAIACQTGVWAQKTGEKLPLHAVPKFDFKVIDEWCNRIAAHETGWETYFCENHIKPLVLFYEDIVACNRGTAEHVLQFLGLPVPAVMEIAPLEVEKQANQISEQWAAAYIELKKEPANKQGQLSRWMRKRANRK